MIVSVDKLVHYRLLGEPKEKVMAFDLITVGAANAKEFPEFEYPEEEPDSWGYTLDEIKEFIKKVSVFDEEDDRD